MLIPRARESCSGAQRFGASSRSLDVIVNVQIVLAWIIPGIVAPHTVHHELAEVNGVMIPHTNGSLEGRFQTRPIVVVEHITVSLVIRLMPVVGVKNGVRKSSSIPHHR